MKKDYGFTIVELLVVIVVVGILAAISIIAYNGINNNAYDTAVKSDLANMAKKIQLDAVERGSIILGGSAPPTVNSVVFPGFTFPVSKSAYSTAVNNLSYCVGTTTSGERTFRIDAQSKSGKMFRYDMLTGLHQKVSGGVNSSSGCSDLTDTSFSYGYYMNTNTWWAWTNG